jgi:hypothetical protein
VEHKSWDQCGYDTDAAVEAAVRQIGEAGGEPFETVESLGNSGEAQCAPRFAELANRLPKP